jgi:tetratricopeptide (TPR) repeat protein
MQPSLVSRRELRATCLCGIIFALVITAGQAVGVRVAGAGAQDRDPTADNEATLVRMRELHQQRKWRESIDEFERRDFAAWPAQLADKASEAFHLRGQAYASLKNGQQAETDFQAAPKYRPQDALIWLSLADSQLFDLPAIAKTRW